MTESNEDGIPCSIKMYNLVCSKRFDMVDGKQDEVLKILKGEDDHPGLCEQVRAIKKAYKAVVGATVFLLSIVAIQAIVWIFEALKSAVR